MRGSREGRDYARLAARALADSGAGAGAQSVIGDRAASIEAIGSALAARARTRRLQRAVVGFGCAAAVVAGAVWFTTSGRFSPVDRGGASARLARESVLTIASAGGFDGAIETAQGAVRAAAGRVVLPGSRLHASADHELVAVFGSGTRVRLAAGAMARVTDLGVLDRFVLESGALGAKVEKLAPGRRFVVATGDTEVEVRGTEFEVIVRPEPNACEPGTRTRVVVREGVVVVRHGTSETRVAAGAAWPECGPPIAASRSIAELPAPGRAAMRHRGGGVSVGVHGANIEARPTHAEPASSTLAEQNDLFAAALAARRRGDRDEARRWLDRLLARYPNGQLVESARAERHRLAEGTRPTTSGQVE